jgi:hypothetical protein
MAPAMSWKTLGPITPSEALPTIARAMNMPPSKARAALSRLEPEMAADSLVAVMIVSPNRFTKQ